MIFFRWIWSGALSRANCSSLPRPDLECFYPLSLNYEFSLSDLWE